MDILKQVLKEIKPTEKEEKEVEDKIFHFLSKLNKNLKDAKAVLGGSGAKNTWLGHAYDADVFVQYNYRKFKDKSDKLSDMLEKALKKSFKGVKRLHGSRDYFQIKKGNARKLEINKISGNTGRVFKFEIVPILKITKAKDALNITDISPLHADWVNESKPLADEIRLTKQFCRANGIYGAESYINGFSGYICEVLTINYGGFLKLIKKAAKWTPKTYVDFVGYYKNKNDAIFNINKSKQQGPMIVVDPVQKERNAAAALSLEKYNRFIDICNRFLKKPSKSYFDVKEVNVDSLKKKSKGKKLIVLKIKSLTGKEDVIGSKLLKAVEFINKSLLKNEFKVYDYGWDWDKDKKAIFWFIVKDELLPSYIVKEGPPVKFEEYAKKFKKNYKGKTYVQRGRIFARDKRKFRDSKKLIKKLIKDKYVKEKVKSISF